MTDIADALRSEAVRLLHEHDIYDVDTYGWSGPDDVDPEYVGYAMWTLDRPYEGSPMGRQTGGHASD